MNTGRKHHNIIRRKQEAGFSLVELVIVILIGAVMVTPLYKMLLTKPNDTHSNLELVLSGLAEHVRIYGSYPCPADPALSPNDANYAAEGNCTAAGGVVVTNGVAIGSVPAEALRIAMDCVETDQTITFGDLIAGNTNISRKSMASIRDSLLPDANRRIDQNLDVSGCISEDNMLDEHGNKLLYAVDVSATTSSATVFDPFNPSSNIEIQDANGNPATAVNPNFVVLSHGEDRKGAVDRDGNTLLACGAEAGLDNENCDSTIDTIFVNTPYANLTGANHFDDTLDFSLAGFEREHNYWNWAGNTGARNLSFSNPALGASGARMIIGPVPATAVDANTKLVIDSAGSYIDLADNPNNNALYIENSNATFTQNLNVNNEITINGTGAGAAPAAMRAGVQVNAPKYCYHPYDLATSDPGCAP